MIQSQNSRILIHLSKGHKITGIEALQLFGTMHLPRRIKDIQEMIGKRIDRKSIVVKSGKRVMQYWLGNK